MSTSRTKALLGWIAGGFLGAVVALFSFASFFLRARPFVLPPELRFTETVEAPALSLRYEGIASWEVSDGETTILIDPTVTRPSVRRMAVGALVPNEPLAKKVFPKADFILVKHAHYDHVIDVPSIALRTGATVLGSRSAVNLALSRGVETSKVREIAPGDVLRLGTFELRVGDYRHSKVLGMREFNVGTIPIDAGPLRWDEYVQDGAMSMRLESKGASVWFGGVGALGEIPSAENVVFAAAGPRHSVETFRRVFAAAGAKRVFISHADNFFQPYAKGFSPLPIVDVGAIAAMVRSAMPGAGVYMLAYGERISVPKDRP